MTELLLVYDDRCILCVRSKNMLQNLICYSQLRWYPLSRITELPNAPIELQDSAQREIALWAGSWHYGWAALTLISARLPQFWVFFPIMYGLQLTLLGPKLYRWIAKNRYLWAGSCMNDDCSLS